MADKVPPRVRLLFACDDAKQDPTSQKWTVTNPWSVVQLPPGAEFPFRAEKVWIYVQLTDGVGSFDLMIEVRQVMNDGTRRLACQSKVSAMDFPGGGQLLVLDEAYQMEKVPFREAGIYEFRVTAAEHGLLDGMIFELRVLDRRATP